MTGITLEFVVFLFLLLLIAAAFDLWLIRAWNRRRQNCPKGAAEVIPPPPKAGRLPAQKAPASAGSAPAAFRGPGSPGKPVETAPLVEVISVKTGTRKPSAVRGGKTARRQERAAIAGQSGRIAHVDISMDIPEGESIRLTLESVGGGKIVPAGGQSAASRADARERAEASAFPAAAAFPAPAPRTAPAWTASMKNAFASFGDDIRTSGRSLFALALVLFLATRLIGLTKFPIYFFTDEAVQTNFAAELVERGFVWDKTEPLPVFFNNAGQYEMNLSVYIQLVPYLIFGKSAFVTRAVSVLITLLGMIAVGLILRRIFRVPLWWSGVLLLSILPVWFLHSRTAFEPGESIAFYAMFLYFYMRYREDSPWMLLPALIFGALSAYTYSPSQVMVAATGALLLISDAGYHWRHKLVALAGLGVLLVTSIPYLYFLYLHPAANRDQLAIVGSYWLNDISFWEKLKLFFRQYLAGLNPQYWFLANPPEGVQHDIIRHLMKGYGHLGLWSLPLITVGILLCLSNIRTSHFRTVLIAMLAAPTGGAIAQITITRVLVMVIPASLLAGLGVSWLLALFERAETPPLPPLPDFLGWWRERTGGLAAAWAALRPSLAERANFGSVRDFLHGWRERAGRIASATQGLARVPRTALALGLFLVLGSANVYMLWDALTNGPTWYDNYELYGMQYGGEQLSNALVEYQKAHPDANLIVSSSWANGTDEIFRFFLPENFPLRTGTVLEYIQNYIPIEPQDVFVMTSQEYDVARSSGRFYQIAVDQTIPYPNGQPGFYFAHLTYVDNIQVIIAAEKAELAKPVEEQIVLGGETVRIVHSRLDMGELAAGFDGDPFSLIRSQQDNPFYLDMFFPNMHRFTRVTVRVGGAPTKVTAAFYPEGGGDPQLLSAEVERASDYRDVVIEPSVPIESSHLRLEIETVGEGEPTHVHVYEITLEAEGWKSTAGGPSS
jgi:hypothetical protein